MKKNVNKLLDVEYYKKLLIALDRLEAERQSGNGKELYLKYNKSSWGNIAESELRSFLKVLQQGEAIELDCWIEDTMDDLNDDYLVTLIFTENFEGYCRNIKEKYEEAMIKSKDILAYYVRYEPKEYKIFINNFFLKKLDFNSENELVFNLLFENPNKIFTKKEIEETLKEPLKKELNSIVQNLNFTGDLRKAFFNVSNKSIKFINPVHKLDLEKIGIKYLSFNLEK